MSQPAVDAPANAGPSGLIDTLQTGFDLLNRNLWLLALPLALDLYLWLGPQLTVGEGLTTWVRSLLGSQPHTQPWGDVFSEGGVSAADLSHLVRDLQGHNLFWLLAVPLLGIPSFRAGMAGRGVALLLDSPGALVLGTIVAVGLGLTLAAVFYGLLGQLVRTGQLARAEFQRELPATWLRTLALFSAASGLLLLLAVPLGLVAMVTASVAPAAFTIVASLLLGVVIWVFLHLFFTTDALYVSLVGPLQAMQRSVRVVRHYFWQSIAFVALLMLISAGFSIILRNIAQSLQLFGMFSAIVGHIYISTGLSAASMTYYRERFERLQTQEVR